MKTLPENSTSMRLFSRKRKVSGRRGGSVVSGSRRPARGRRGARERDDLGQPPRGLRRVGPEGCGTWRCRSGPWAGSSGPARCRAACPAGCAWAAGRRRDAAGQRLPGRRVSAGRPARRPRGARSLTGRMVLAATSASTRRMASRDLLGLELRGVAGLLGRAGGRSAGGPPAASLSSTRRTIRFAPAWRYWKIASWKRRSRS